MQHVMKHDLTQDLARKAAERAFDAYREQYGKYQPSLSWLSDTKARATFSVKGIQLSGTIELLPKAIAFDLDVPFVFRVFRSRAVAIMERELKVWTDKAKAGEI
jgi:putative polyhydroxyalkanoic acid system protein